MIRKYKVPEMTNELALFEYEIEKKAVRINKYLITREEIKYNDFTLTHAELAMQYSDSIEDAILRYNSRNARKIDMENFKSKLALLILSK